MMEPTSFKGAEGWALEAGPLRVVLTRYGGKIQSLRHAGRELLWQRNGAAYRYSEYGDIFETGEFSGFDDMFPNISAGAYPGGVWDGTSLPDHGEVWSMLWQCEARGDALFCAAHGVRLPYRLEKTLRLSPQALTLNYTAHNLSHHPLKYIWAAHPLFVLEEGTRLVLPGCREILNASPDPGNLGGFGAAHPWPVSRSGRDMSVLSPQNKTCNKYYVWNDPGQTTARLEYPGGLRVTLEAPHEQAPYMGVWIDEAGYGGHNMACAAPEPCTGALDRLDLADLYGRISVLPPQGSARWQLTIRIDEGEQP